MSIVIERADLPGFSMRYFRFGRGGSPLVILPGLSIKSVMETADAVRNGYAAFEEDFTVFVLDRRAVLPPAYPIREAAKDTAAALDALGVRDACFFGASQGGMIAMEIAVSRPDLVRRLALGSTASDVRGARYRRIAEWIGLARKKDAVGLYLAFGAAIYPPAVFEKYRGVLVRIGETVTEEELERFIILAEGTKDFFVTDRLVGIRCPVFVIGSRDDAVLGPDAAAEIAGHVPDEPGCQTYIYDGYGHAAFDTAPDYREKLLRFFSDPDAPERRFTCRTADHT